MVRRSPRYETDSSTAPRKQPLFRVETTHSRRSIQPRSALALRGGLLSGGVTRPSPIHRAGFRVVRDIPITLREARMPESMVPGNLTHGG